MPNNIKNRIVVLGSIQDVERLFNKYNTHIEASLNRATDDSIICKDKTTDEFSVGWLDEHTGIFTRREEDPVIGLPEGWEMEINQPIDCFPDFRKIISPPDDPAYRDEPSQDAVRGNPNWWYNWNKNNWGTKWNSYSHERESWNTFVFETAWANVKALMLILSKSIPETEIIYEYADEDTGYNCGYFKIKNGEILESEIPKGGTIEAYDLSFKLRPEYKDGYQIIDGKYEYVEEEE